MMDSGLDKLREHILRTMPGISSGPHALLVFMPLSSVSILEGLKSICNSSSVSKFISMLYVEGFEN